MEKKMTDAKMQMKERQKKFFLFLPVVVIPFITLLLWSMGIVGTVGAQTNTGRQKSGFNVNLPVARQAKDSNWNKLQYYAQADKDSERLRSMMRDYHGDSSAVYAAGNTGSSNASGITMNTDPKEQLIEQKIVALNKKLNEPVKANSSIDPENSSYENEIPDPPPAQKRAALQRMKEEQQWASQPAVPDNIKDTEQADPELTKLDGMLNKVLDIQHPERVQQQLQQESEKNKKLVYPVSMKESSVDVSLLQSGQDTTFKECKTIASVSHFYGLNDNVVSAPATNAIAAAIPEEQVLVNGATVKLQLLNDVYISGVLIPKNQLLYGVASLKGERLDIVINSIGYNGQLLPVFLSVYDMDGQQGLYIPGAIMRDVAKQSADQGIETMNFGTYDASLGAQAASAGIQAAKTLIGKKVKLVKVTVRSGYRVWLRDMNNKEDGR